MGEAPPRRLVSGAIESDRLSKRFSNEYILREARTPKACALCQKPSVFVLVSLSVPQWEFLYVCIKHVSDATFARRVSALQARDAHGSNALEPATPNRDALAHDSCAAPLHAHYTLHREFFAQRMRHFHARVPRSALQFPTVPTSM